MNFISRSLHSPKWIRWICIAGSARFRRCSVFLPCKQKSLEAYAGFSRTDRFSGEELIHVYEDYLASGDEELLRLLYLHNREDLTGMTEILSLYSIPSLFSGHFQPVARRWTGSPGPCPFRSLQTSLSPPV